MAVGGVIYIADCAATAGTVWRRTQKVDRVVMYQVWNVISE